MLSWFYTSGFSYIRMMYKRGVVNVRIPRNKDDVEDFHHYKIGELSKNLDMPAVTIRSYDKNELIKPNKRGENEYRSYTVIDGNYFIMFKEYQNLGLKLSEVSKILTDSNIKEFEESFETINEKLNNDLFWLKKRIEGLEQKQKRCAMINTNLNKITIVERPAMYRIKHQEYDLFVEGKDYPSIRKKWTDAMPAVYFTYIFTQDDMIDYKNKISANWGLSVNEVLVEGTGLDKLPYTEYIPSRKCVYTIVSSSNEVYCKPRYFGFVMEYLEKNGLKLTGDIYGSFICNVKNDNVNGYTSYYEGYFPI